MGKWSKERAWEWYNARPWIRGCNFMGSDCANRIDQWQEYGCEERFTTADREMELAEKTGFNSIRILMDFFVWHEEHDGYMERLEHYLSMAHSHGLSVMIVFGNDCMPPKEESLARLYLGEQHWDVGYHGGRKVSQHGKFDTVGYSLLDDPALAPLHYEMVREIVTKYRDDGRVLIWDVFNEPGNSNRGSLSLPHVRKYFEIIRGIDPIQPLTSAVWSREFDREKMPEAERFVLDESDVVSYHNYSSYEENVMGLAKLAKTGRPILNTEWLARCQHNNVQEMFPLFYLFRVGCYNWGLVAGKYQTFEPWNGVWDRYDEDPDMDFDFTKWFHDLYRPNLRPYDPHEIEMIRRFCEQADKDFAEQNGL